MVVGHIIYAPSKGVNTVSRKASREEQYNGYGTQGRSAEL